LANFKTHYNVGIISGIISSASFVSLSILNSLEGILCLLLWVVGSISPDIDSPNSKPIKVFFYIISIILSCSFFFFSMDRFYILESIVLSIFIFLILNFILPKIFSKFSTHRGIIHSIPFAFLLGFFISILLFNFFNLQDYLSILAGFFFAFGFMIHLLLDELYSVDLSGVKLKNSFGSAFKLYDKKQPFLSMFIYIIILFEMVILPPINSGIAKVLDISNIQYLKDNFFPFYIQSMF
jgi:membrane-bound metal-dependent hydrolase YbcI (DUF457 family)